MDFHADFAEEAVISKQFGVSEYLLLSASNPSKPINDQDYIDMLLSALNVATVNTECPLPIFVQIGEPANHLYAGVGQNRNARTCFEGAYLKSFMYKHKYLDGLVDIFKEKVNTPLNLDRAIQVSVELNYTYKKVHRPYCRHQYPFGADLDPLRELSLSVCWVNVKESVLTENESYSDLEPSSTPKWFASATFHSDSKYQLSATLTEILDCRDGPCSSCTLKSFGGQELHSTDSAANVLSPLTKNYASSQLNFVNSKAKIQKIFLSVLRTF
uniref:Uncharacterized protein n=1 Tax=Ditylenchus dipsaci TaxID=166011 RepID=A0A915DN61_9BILA